MKDSNYFEIIVGTFVLLCAGFFFFYSVNSAKIKTSGGGYNIIAKFDDVSGIEAGSDVMVSGIKIGTVENSLLDIDSYRATLKILVDKAVKLPSDSSAKIASSGLLGSKYLEITPGADTDFLQEGDEIFFTQSSVNFEDLLAKFIFNGNDKKESKK